MKIFTFLLLLGGAMAAGIQGNAGAGKNGKVNGGVGGNAGAGKNGKVNGNVNADLGSGGCGQKGPSVSAQGQAEAKGPGSASGGKAGASGSIDLGGKNSGCATPTTETGGPETTETPTTTEKPCKQAPTDTSYLAGIRTDKTFPDGEITFFYECYGNKSHYTGGGVGYQRADTPKKAECKPARYVGAKVNITVTDGDIVSYGISCNVLFSNGTTDGGRITKSSFDFDNKMVRCDEYQAMSSLQAIKHDDGKYEIKIDCQGFKRI